MIFSRPPSRRFSILLVLCSGLTLAACHQSEPVFEGENTVPTVHIRIVQPTEFMETRELPARIEAIRIAEVRARVPGIVLERHFVEGVDVQAGDILFTIDPAPFEVALERAKAVLARAEAAVFEAQTLTDRYRSLVELDAISRQEFDSAEAKLHVALAERQSARADIKSALLDLEYAAVTAPISGRIGRALVTEGALVGQNEATALANIQQIETVFVDIRQSAGGAVMLREAVANGALTADQQGLISLSIEGTAKIWHGQLLFSDISVDKSTGQVLLRGEFNNADGVLLPGMYAQVTINQGIHSDAILVPQRAVKRGLDGRALVFTVDAQNVVHEQAITTGVMTGSEWHVQEGLYAGDRVVVDAPLSLMAGMTVQVSNPSPSSVNE